jgi:hypothetical protein
MKLDPKFIVPKDGWALLKSCIENNLLMIRWLESDRENADSHTKQESEEKILDALAQFIGHIFMIATKMSINGHVAHAKNMRVLLAMAMSLDSNNPQACDALYKKCDEFAAIR